MSRGAQVPRSRARRRIAALALAVLVLLPVVVLLLLRLPLVQGRILAVALRRAEAATGLSLKARSFSVDPFTGLLHVEGLTAAVPGSRPFLDVDSIDADMDLTEALRRRLLVERLSIDGVDVDLGAPLPSARGAAKGVEPSPLAAIEIDQIDVGISSIVSGPLPPSLERVALAAQVADLRLTGILRRGALRLHGDVSSLTVDRPGPLRLKASGTFAFSVTPAGRLLLEDLRLAGPGFSATASGTGALTPDVPLAMHAEAHVVLDSVVPELDTTGALTLVADVRGPLGAIAADVVVDGRDVDTPEVLLETLSAKVRLRGQELLVEDARAALWPSGRARGGGRWDLTTEEGTWTIRGERLPDALLADYLDDAARARMGLAGTELDTVATIRHGGGDPLSLSVDADLSLRRGATPLALAKAHLTSRGRADLDLSATLLPASPGERKASGHVRAASIGDLASGRLTDGRLEAAVPELSAALAELRTLFPALVPDPPTGVDLRGALRLDVRAAGPVRAPAADVEAIFQPSAGGSVALLATADAGRRSSEGRLAVGDLPLQAVKPGATGRASADVLFAIGPDRRDVRVDLDATGLCLAEEQPLVETFHASFEADRDELRVFSLAADSGGSALPVLGPMTRLEASGRLALAAPLDDADVDVTLSAAGLAGEAHGFLRDGVLTLDVPRAGAPGLGATLAARLPLGALRSIPALAERLPEDLPDGPVELTLDAPGLDTCALERFFPPGTLPVPLAGDLRAFATFDLSDPLGGIAEIAVEGLGADSVAGRLELAGPARLTLRDGRLALEPVEVRGERTSFSLAAEAEVAPGARPGAPLSTLFSQVAASAHGRAGAALFAPFLAGGTASGEITVDVRAAGPPDSLEGRVSLDGTGTRFSWPFAWPTEIRDPVLEADVSAGVAKVTRGEARLNGGPLLLSGRAVQGVGASLTASFADVRYRLSYGLAAVLSGELTLDVFGEERRVSGNVTLDRGFLDRDVDLDREILARVLAPPESPGTEASLLDTIALDVGIGTTSGIRIRNNVADLSASWTRLDVTGTARRPVVKGRVDVARNGLVFAYGQTFRVDKGVVTYTGDPATDPRLDFVTTSSLQDRSIGARTASGDVFADAATPAGVRSSEDDAAAELAHGLAGYYGDRLASRLGAALGRVSLSVRPLLLLGEADPAARLTLARDFSPNVSLAVGIDLKNAQRQTWVLDVHGLRRLPPLAAQAFTEDYGRYGGSVQQRIELGGRSARGEGPAAPLLGEVRVVAPRGVPRRAFVSATRLERGDPVDRASLFEAEIDAEAFLRQRGWPESRVTLHAVPAKKAARVDVETSIDLGPRVDVVFTGDRPSSAQRTAIAGLYRTGTLEPAALDDMRLEAIRSFRSLGHVSPEVTVTVSGTAAQRRVAVDARAGGRVKLVDVAFTSVTPREDAVLARRFSAPLERTELAAGLPSADGRLLDALHGLGYPKASVLGRNLGEGGRLVVEVDPGPPSLVDSVEVRGVPPDEAERLSRLARLAPGDTADADRTALSALAMEDALRSGGFAEARVKAVLAPATPEDPPRLAVAFDVEPGKAERLGSVTIEGLARTDARWARRVADLAPGRGFRREDLDEARGALFALGLFRSVRGEAVPGPDGRVDVVLTADELPPLTLAYGLRWENERGFAAVVDVADRNVLGRALTLGARALYDPSDRALRLFASVPERILGAALDVWVERRRTSKDGLLYGRRTDSTEGSVQLSRSFGRFLSARVYGRLRETRFFEYDDYFPVDVTLRLPYAGVQLVWDTREDPLLGTRGVLASIDLQGSGSWLGSDFAFGRAYGQVNHYRPVFAFGGGRAIWAQSVRAGFARAFQGQELIPDLRFFAGGSYSVRGYRTESLGPRQELGGTLFATGGTTLLVVNEELRLPVHPRLLGVAFFDAGQVWESSRAFGTGLATSAGLGVRALTPLGVLRLDGAVPLNRREGDPAWRVTFGFGNVF